jgi:ubiquinone/menaquinone biosynthesis C-methylase UbiE
MSGWGFAASTGLDFTEVAVVDAHFAACEQTYGELLGAAGIEPGDRVLDAGCGGGAFLPLIAELVGVTGHITAVDLAPENSAVAARRAELCCCPVEVSVADVTRLPFADNSFDLAWCSNTVQYLDDEQLGRALAELRRVVRPGGTVAVKDLDASLVTIRPGDPFLFVDMFRRAARQPGYARQLLRSRDLRYALTAAGLTDVRQTTVLIEHYGPLPGAVRRFYGPTCTRMALLAGQLDMPGDWTCFLDQDSPANPLNDPAAYVSEGAVLARGTVPAEKDLLWPPT